MPGCTLEVWDKDTNVESENPFNFYLIDHFLLLLLLSITFQISFSTGKGSLWYAEEEEKKGANAGNLRDAVDRLLLRVP